MTTLAPPPPPTRTSSAGASTSTVAGRAWRWTRIPLVILVLLVVGVSALTIANLDTGGGPELDPYSYRPDGANALRTITAERGVQVNVVDSSRKALDGAGADATIFVPRPRYLSLPTIRAMAALSPRVRLVLLDPDTVTMTTLAPGVRLSTQSTAFEPIPPDCALPEAKIAGPAELTGIAYEAPAPAVRCYAGGLVVKRQPNLPEVVLLGGDSQLHNENLADAGNAALMMNLLSARSKLFWLDLNEPETTGGAGGDEDPRSIFPAWTETAMIYLLVAGFLAALWSGRRLGTPVAEPLPVVVRSAEAVEGRARMYRRARARNLAAGALRAGAMSRMAPALGLGPEPDPRAAVPTLASRTGRTSHEVHRVLYGPVPADDAALVALSHDLDRLTADTLAVTRVNVKDSSAANPAASESGAAVQNSGATAPATQNEGAANSAATHFQAENPAEGPIRD